MSNHHDLSAVATLERPNPFRTMPRPEPVRFGECASCREPCTSLWGAIEDEVRFCAECLERGRPAGLDDEYELGGRG